MQSNTTSKSDPQITKHPQNKQKKEARNRKTQTFNPNCYEFTCGICQALGISNLEAAKICVQNTYTNKFSLWRYIDLYRRVGRHRYKRRWKPDLLRIVDETNADIPAVTLGRSFHWWRRWRWSMGGGTEESSMIDGFLGEEWQVRKFGEFWRASLEGLKYNRRPDENR